jgi:8-oxo-dGTP diphosphatase
MITCSFEKGYEALLRHLVVHAIVDNGNGILLVKRTGDLLESGKWGLPGGYLDRDETASEGALRELREETGWEGEIVSLFRINTLPNRPHEDRQNVSFDFIIRPLRQIGLPDAESSKVEFIPFENLYQKDRLAFDHGDTIELYRKYKQSAYPLPLFS